MEDIWLQFHRLPRVIRDGVATPSAIATVDRLERQYPGLDLAGLIMRAMIKEFPPTELASKIASESNLDEAVSRRIVADLTTSVFSQVKDYLGLANPPPVAPSPARPAVAPPPSSSPDPTPPVRPITPTPPRPSPARPMAAVPPALTLAPKPLTTFAPTQNYSAEEDQEIAQQARRVQNIATSGTTIDIDELASQTMRQHNLAFRDELLQKRAVSLFKARLKGIRDSDDTKAMLQRAPKVGGLGLDPDLSANVLASLDQAAKQLKSRGAVRPPPPPEPPRPPVVPKVQPQPPTPRPPLTRGLPPSNLPVAPVAPLPNVTDQPRPAPMIKRPADIPPPVTTPVRVPTPVPQRLTTSPMAAPLVTRERQPERLTMADITRPTVPVMGPAGEMSSLSLMEWRRLGQGAADSASRLLDKFRHYQKESFSLWAEAVAGWRQSEVHRIYLDMGRQSIDSGQPISQIIQQRAKTGLPYLSEHEFSTVADFNKQLQL